MGADQTDVREWPNTSAPAAVIGLEGDLGSTRRRSRKDEVPLDTPRKVWQTRLYKRTTTKISGL
jgi:hypothetical protein